MFAQTFKKAVAAVAVTVALTGGAASAMAQSADWNADHARRAEVNQRLEKQDQRIKNEVKEGDMGKAKAARLHKEDRKIRHEERRMAAKDGSHITKHEQKVLNKQENAVSRQIGQ